MFEDSEIKMKRLKSQREDALLDCFILLENNNYESTKQALLIYMRLSGLNALKAMDEMREKYNQFIDKK